MKNDYSSDKRYVILLNHIPGFETTDALIRKHVAYLRELDCKGQLVLCGPFLDYPGGMLVIHASSAAEAIDIAKRDPFVAEGVRAFEVRTWLLSSESNNHLGMD